MDLLKYLDARMGEASTYSGIAALLLLAHVSIDPGTLHTITLVGTLLAAALAVVLQEKGSKPPLAIASDVLAAIAPSIQALLKPAAPAPVGDPPNQGTSGVAVAVKATMLALLCGSLIGLSACSTSAPTPKQVVADAQAVVTSLYVAPVNGQPAGGLLPIVAALDPSAIPPATLAKIEAEITMASSMLQTLSTAIATTPGSTAPVLQQVNAYLGDALAVLSAIPGIPEPYAGEIQAANALLPEISALVAIATQQ